MVVTRFYLIFFLNSQQAIRSALHSTFLPKLKLDELFLIDTNSLVAQFLALARTTPPSPNPSSQEERQKVALVRDEQWTRNKTSVDMQLAIKYFNTYRLVCGTFIYVLKELKN